MLTRTTACAAIPSPFPVKPRCSSVVALTRPLGKTFPWWSGSCVCDIYSHLLYIGLQLRGCATTVEDQHSIRIAALHYKYHTGGKKHKAVDPFVFRITVGKIMPISRERKHEQCIADGVVSTSQRNAEKSLRIIYLTPLK